MGHTHKEVQQQACAQVILVRKGKPKAPRTSGAGQTAEQWRSEQD
jgi:hypothetical protein